MLAWRGLFGALGIAAVALMIEGRAAWHNILRLGWAGWLYAVLSAGGMVLFIASLRQTTVAHVAVIYATVPFFAAALGWMVMRDVPSRSAVVASIAALNGVVVMVGFGREGGLLGDMLALGMTVAMVGMMVLARRLGNGSVLAAAAPVRFVKRTRVLAVGIPPCGQRRRSVLPGAIRPRQLGCGTCAVHPGSPPAAARRDRAHRRP